MNERPAAPTASLLSCWLSRNRQESPSVNSEKLLAAGSASLLHARPKEAAALRRISRLIGERLGLPGGPNAAAVAERPQVATAEAGRAELLSAKPFMASGLVPVAGRLPPLKRPQLLDAYKLPRSWLISETSSFDSFEFRST